MHSMVNFMEADRERLLKELSDKPLELAPKIVQEELDRIHLKYLEVETMPERQAAAGHILESLKALSYAIACNGETRISRKPVKIEASPRKAPLWFWGLIAAGGISALRVILEIIQLRAAASAAGTWIPVNLLTMLLPILEGCAFFAAGVLAVTKTSLFGSQKQEQMVEVLVDAERLYRMLYAAMLVVDRELAQVESAPALEAPSAQLLLGAPEMDLCVSILEAGYASEDALMKECTENLKYYLHRRGIEAIDDVENNRAMFEIMPGIRKEVVFPALVEDGRVLRRGMATGYR